MSDRPVEQSGDADLRGSRAALLRAAARARELARQTGTRLVVGKGGVVRYIRQDKPGIAEQAAPYDKGS